MNTLKSIIWSLLITIWVMAMISIKVIAESDKIHPIFRLVYIIVVVSVPVFLILRTQLFNKNKRK